MRTTLLLLVLAVAGMAGAQTNPADSTTLVRWDFHESDFFAYRITTTTAVKRYFPKSDLPSDYTRELTYFLSQRVTTIGKDGIVTVEANIDSMRLKAHNSGVDSKFDSQGILLRGEEANFNDPEVLGTSMILNKPFTYRMTLEGDFIDVGGFEAWKEQIDTASQIDSNMRHLMEEYMDPAFLRTLVLPHEGFGYNRRYKTKQEWIQGVPRRVFTIPTIDTAQFRIEIPSTRKRYFLYSDGRLYAQPQVLHDHGFKELSTLDSVSGTMQDTLLMEHRGHIQELGRTASLRAFLHTSQLAYSEVIREETVIRLEGYESR